MMSLVSRLLALAAVSGAIPFDSESEFLSAHAQRNSQSSAIIRAEHNIEQIDVLASAIAAPKPPFDGRRPGQQQRPPQAPQALQAPPAPQIVNLQPQVVTVTVVQTVDRTVFYTPAGCVKTQAQPAFGPVTWGINPPGAPPIVSTAAPGLVNGLGSLLGTVLSGWKSVATPRTSLASAAPVGGGLQDEAIQASPQPLAATMGMSGSVTSQHGISGKPGYTPPSLPGSGFWGDRH